MLRALGEVSRELGAGLWALLTALVPAGEGAQGAQGAAEIPVVLQLLPDPLGQAWGETESKITASAAAVPQHSTAPESANVSL